MPRFSSKMSDSSWQVATPRQGSMATKGAPGADHTPR